MDLDVQFGDVAFQLGLRPKLSLLDLLEAGGRLDGALLRATVTEHPSGLKVIASPPDMMPLEGVSSEHVLQIVDLAAAHGRVAKRRLAANADTESFRLADARWSELAAGRHHLTLLPPPACGVPAAPYLPMQLFAADHGLTFNSGYLARWNLGKTRNYCAQLGHDLATGAWSADDLYVVGDTWRARFERTAPTANCVLLDGYDACIVDAPAPGSDATR